MWKHAAANGSGKLTELSKFVLTEMNGKETFKSFLNGNKRKWSSQNFPLTLMEINGAPSKTL